MTKIEKTITDVDKVFVSNNTSANLLKFLCEEGYISESGVKDVRHARKAYGEGNISYLDMATVLEREYLNAFSGKTPDKVDSIVKDFLGKYPIEVYWYTNGLVEILKQRGPIIGITAGAYETAPSVRERVGLDILEAPERFELKNGVYVPNKLDDWVGFKEETVEMYNDGRPFAAAGDAITDVPLLEIATVPMVFNPDNEMLEISKERNWPIFTEYDNEILNRIKELLS